MATFSLTNSATQEISNLISTKPMLISRAELLSLGSNIKLVGYDPILGMNSTIDRSFSPRLINWVESYEVKGILKTLFYTEINSALKVGDRVFIVNGNYDSDLLIESDKYKKGRDGYKVLYIDNCKVVLDINYTGVKPWKEDIIDNFIKVYYIRNQQEFLHANRQVTTRDGFFDYKFNRYQNTISFIDQDYTTFAISGARWGLNGGVVGSPGFFVRNGRTQSWTNITTEFTDTTNITASYSYALSPIYYNNDRIKIMNGDFTYNGKQYKEGYVYKWIVGPTQSDWVVDVTYFQPLLSKNNFRDGDFDGIWNTGIFGRQNKQITWEGDKSTWNTGTLLNTTWKKGTFNSLYNLVDSYFSGIDEYGLPYQKSKSYNNGGKGLNYIINSNIESSIINNGTIIRTVIGSQSATYSIVEKYITGSSSEYLNTIITADFDTCELNNSHVSNSELRNIRANNTLFEGVKSVNSYFKNSVFHNSTYNSDDIIKILGYDEINAAEHPTLSSQFSSISGTVQKVYKFYITEASYNRLKTGDKFYIKGLKINDNSKNVINFFDKKFRINAWSEYVEDYDIYNDRFFKRGIEFSAFLSTPEENSYLFNTQGTSATNFKTYRYVNININKLYSIDIWAKLYDIDYPSISNEPPLIGNHVMNFNTSEVPVSYATPSTSLGSIVDISNAYIIDSDFDSGLFENSQWNSGNHINYNNDSNITIQNSIGGQYNLSVATSSGYLIATSSFDKFFPEGDLDYLSVGSVVFLDTVDYNDYYNRIIFSNPSISLGPSSSIYSYIISLTYSGQYLLEFDTVLNDDLVIYDGTVAGGNLIDSSLTYTYASYSYSKVLSITSSVITISSGGYTLDNVPINNLNVSITSVSASRLPDAYKVVSKSDASSGSNQFGVYELQEIITGSSSQIIGVTASYFYTKDAKNRYNYIKSLKIDKSDIKSGIFKRPYIKESIIQSETYDSSDKEYTNLNKLRSLVVTDSIYSDKSNILSSATYLYSSFVKGTDVWNDGIIQNSIWISGTFSSGVIKESTWVNGSFVNGSFYGSRSFDANPTTYFPLYNSNRIRSYYKDGVTLGNIYPPSSATVSNDRYSWQNGNFINGDFYKSDWEGGTFSGGRFWNSKWYNGLFENGLIGSNQVSTLDTKFYNGTVSYAVVENATLYAEDTSLNKNINASIEWNDGYFNEGVFGSNISQTASNSAIWNNGTFNGGQFVSNGRWKKGTFNNGLFVSGYGWTQSDSLTQSNYTWESGTFNNGKFGNANGLTNSTWYTGEFSGGIFRGRVWNNGIFLQGELQGSGGSTIGGLTCGVASDFVDSFSYSYWGLWRSGIFTDIKDKFINNQPIYTIPTRARLIKSRGLVAKFKNGLWQSGTFNHSNGEMSSSVWLDGSFKRGKFIGSSFNPYVKRNGSTQSSFNLNDSTCYWQNGDLESSDFYISRWKNGNFNLGTATGMIWENGVCKYMNAFNIFWEKGLWRNGNWYGSSFEFNGLVTSDYVKQILFRGMSWSGTSSTHVWNIFLNTEEKETQIANAVADTPTYTYVAQGGQQA
jgi:hypothetical protein